MELLIKGARIIDSMQDFIGDVYINNGVINKVGRNIEKNCKIIDGEGLILLPSFVDTHAHFRDPGLTYKEDIFSGCKAAVKGGYTGVNLMANTKPVCSNMDIVYYVLSKAKEIGLVDIHQCISITKNFDGSDISHLKDIKYPVTIISEDGKDVDDNNTMLQAMFIAKKMGLTIMSHSEDSQIAKFDSRISENIMSLRNIELAKISNCKFHLCHVSTKESMKYIIDAKDEYPQITCEITPHHIALTDEINYTVNPPLRKKEDVKFIINSIKKGYVDAIGTDHAPHSKEDKEKGLPGISGIETAFSILYTSLVKEGHISLNDLSRIMSKNPAQIIGFNKGIISPGYDGDLVLIDINKNLKINSEEFKSKGKNTPFNNKNFYGEIIMTIKAGKIVYNNSEQ